MCMILKASIPGVASPFAVEADLIPDVGTEIHVSTRDVEGYFKVGRVEYKMVQAESGVRLEVHLSLYSS